MGKYIEDAKQEEKDVPDLLEAIMRRTCLVKEKLRPILFKMNAFLGGGLTTTTTLEKSRVANEPRDQILVGALYFQTPKLRIPEIPASDTCASRGLGSYRPRPLINCVTYSYGGVGSSFDF